MYTFSIILSLLHLSIFLERIWCDKFHESAGLTFSEAGLKAVPQ